MFKRALLSAGLIVVLSACGGGDDDSPPDRAAPAKTSAAPAPTSAAPKPVATKPVGPEPIDVDVPWEDYAPDVRTRIDGLYSNKDCAGLQQEFDIADANNAATMARTGHNNADLMEYIDKGLQQADCY